VILPPARGRASGPGPLLTPAPIARRNAAIGISAIELLLTIAVIGALAAAAAPGMASLESSVAIRSAAAEAGAAILRARAAAISRNANVGLKYRKNGDHYEWTIYADGNGNGVRTADITRGIDRPLASFGWTRNDVHPGILTGASVPDPGDTRSYLDRVDDPIRFNASDICSFSPLGESTPGSIYLWDGRDRMAVVRVFGRSGKLRTLYYRRGERTWTP
jgi:type II secretory pathway pseudopilin PulG